MVESITNSWIYAALILFLLLFCVYGADLVDVLLRKLNSVLQQELEDSGKESSIKIDKVEREVPQKKLINEAIMKMQVWMRLKSDPIPTGILPLDLALGVGGVPRGQIIEVYGPELSGKTTLTSHVIATVQKAGGVAAFIDVDNTFDSIYAHKIGVDIKKLHISKPRSLKEALEIAESLSRSGAIDIIVVHSVLARSPKAEIQGGIHEDSLVGTQARLLSQALRQLCSIISASKTSIIFIHQLHHKVGILFSNPESTPGGLALKFYASVRMDIRKVKAIKQDDKVIGAKMQVRIVKNKLAAPNRNADFEILNDQGISIEGSLVDLGLKTGLIQKHGEWFVYKTEHIGQNLEKAKAYFKAHRDKATQVETELRVKLLLPSKKNTVEHPVEKPGIRE